MAASLARHLADGRLSIEEHSQRLDEVYAARTRGELARATRDLPPPTPSRTPVPARPTGDTARSLVGLATPSAVSVGVWAARGMHGSFWPLWVMVVNVAVGLRHFARDGRRRHGANDAVGRPGFGGSSPDPSSLPPG